MKSETIVVYHKGGGMMLYVPVAEKHGLKDGQHINTALFWTLIKEQSEYGIALCKERIAEQEIGTEVERWMEAIETTEATK